MHRTFQGFVERLSERPDISDLNEALVNVVVHSLPTATPISHPFGHDAPRPHEALIAQAAP